MVDTECVAEFLVVSEDTGGSGPDTVIRILGKMLQSIRPCDVTRLEFSKGSQEIRRGAGRNAWRNSDQQSDPNVVRLIRSIATRVASGDGYVFFHVDGDVPWAARDSSVTATQFKRLLVDRVGALLHQELGGKRSAAEIEQMLRRIVLCMPYYSIEAWCYQNTSVAVSIALKHSGDSAAEVLREWGRDRSALDEVVKPKEKCCLAAKFNLDLAGARYPVDEVLAVGKSFAETQRRLLHAPGMRELLERCARAC